MSTSSQLLILRLDEWLILRLDTLNPSHHTQKLRAGVPGSNDSCPEHGQS